MIFSRLGNMVTNKDRKKTTKELHEIEKKKNYSDKKKEEIYDHLVNLVKTLNKKEKYQYHDRDDLDYHGIRDIENSFRNVDDDDYYYYKPILIKRSFLRIMTNIMTAEKIKTKKTISKAISLQDYAIFK